MIVKPFKGDIDLIKFCIYSKVPIALVTSIHNVSFKIISYANLLLNLLETMIFGDDKYISTVKPSPDPYL